MAGLTLCSSLLFAVIILGYVSLKCTAGWVDPDTPDDAKEMISLVDGRTYTLVGSDEFMESGRKFSPGSDPMWTGTDHSDDSNTGGTLSLGSQQYYNSTMLTTNDGYLNISTSSDMTKWKGWNPYKHQYEEMNKTFRSGMVTGWNKFCFTGGKIDIRARLPGKAHTPGLWPAIWMLGNLGRPTFEASTNLVWPWSYNECSLDKIEAQEINACLRTRHYGLKPGQGRGATEIDILEAMAGDEKHLGGTPMSTPYFSSTLQLAPGVPKNRPNFGQKPTATQTWYTGMEYGENSTQNVYFYGSDLGVTSVNEPTMRTAKQAYQADSVSAVTNVVSDLFDNFHNYGLEWVTGPEGYIKWYLDDVLIFSVSAPGLKVTGAQIPEEPSYLIFNTAVSSSWGFPLPCPDGCDCTCFDCNDPSCVCGIPVGMCDMLPAHFLVDYVRVYQVQNDSSQYTGCDPIPYPTRRFMHAHKDRYTAKTSDPLTSKLVTGGHTCTSDKECGHGACSGFAFLKWCKCEEGWHGPNCLVTKKFEETPAAWDVGNTLEFHSIDLPAPFYIMLVTIAAGVVVSTCFNVREKQNARVRR